MTSIPDSISFEDLIALKETASQDPTESKDDSEMTVEDYLKAADCVDTLCEKYGDPMLDKLVIMNRLQRLMAYHSESAFTEESPLASVCWGRDAGKLQAMMCIMAGIAMGSKDFLYSEQHPEDND